MVISAVLKHVAAGTAAFAITLAIPGNASGPIVLGPVGATVWHGIGMHANMRCVVADGFCVVDPNPPANLTCQQNLLVDNNTNGWPDPGDTISCKDSI